MSDQQADDDQRRDKLLLRLLKTPPQPRPKRERTKAKPIVKNRKSRTAVRLKVIHAALEREPV